MSGDFTYVSHTRKSRKNKYRKPDDPPVPSLEDRFPTTQLRFLETDFCARCLNAFREVVKIVPSPERMVCLGLGSLVDGEGGAKRISEVQLALLIELNKLFDVPIVAYDPVFRELDIEFLKTLDIKVETFADDDYNSSSIRTLFYLPHCDRSTNEGVISNLLSTSSLDNAILLGNDFRNYANILTDAQFKNFAPIIFKAVNDEMLEFRNLEPKHGEEYWDAFSDLCLMWPKQKPVPEDILQDKT